MCLADPSVSIEDDGDRDIAHLNFARVIRSYVTPIAQPEPQTALQYAYLIALASDAPDGRGEKQKQLCLQLVRDIVLASRGWAKLLGSVRADGTKEVSLSKIFPTTRLT
jgi:nuclear pore complex protein Nup93